MTIALGILAVIAIIVIGILLYAATRPDTFRIARSATIHAPASTLCAILTDLRRGVEWSPFEKGLTMSNSKEVGTGKFSIMDVTPAKITCNLVMLKPMKADNIVEYALAPQGNATVVTWSMYGPTTLMTRVMSLFMDMDKMCGDQFEKGLKDLKVLAESEAQSLPDNSRIAAA